MPQQPVDSTGTLSVRATQRVTIVADRLERWIQARGVVTIALVTALISLVKGGVGVFEGPIWPLDDWPYPVEAYPPLTYGFRLPGWVLGAETRAAYTWIALASILIGVVAIGWVWRRTLVAPTAKWVVMLFVGGPALWIVWGGIGRTDIFVVVAGVMLGALGRRPAWALAAAVVAVLGHPEQAVTMSLALLIVSLSGTFKAWRRGISLAFAASLMAYLTLSFWSASRGIPSRANFFGDYWKQSPRWFFIQLPLELYAGFGITIIVVLWALLDQRGRDIVFLALGALVLPLGLTALTLDQSRILVACSAGAVAAILTRYGPTLFQRLNSVTRFPLAATSLVVITLPAVELTANVIRVPWEFYFPYLQSYVLDLMPVG